MKQKRNQATLFGLLIGLCVLFPGLMSPVMGDEPNQEWTITLSGVAETTLEQQEFESMINPHENSSHFASLVDSDGQVWDGLPLWLLPQISGKNQVTRSSFDTAKPWSLTLIGKDGRQVTLDSKEVTQNNAYILAYALNGKTFSLSETQYPLALVGKDLMPDQKIDGISQIRLSPGW
jgi:hypothetical protein